jgi:arsenite methyltransferase
MLEKARDNAKKYGYKNVEFRQGDIENKVPIEDNSVDVVISNCVINLNSNKVNALKEVYRVLKPKVEKMVISDLVKDKEVDANSIDSDNWCSRIDGALTKDKHIKSMREAGSNTIEILEKTIFGGRTTRKRTKSRLQWRKKNDNEPDNKVHQRVILVYESVLYEQNQT